VSITFTLITEGLRLLGLSITPSLTDSFLVYLEELKRWNKRVCNLTSLTNDEDIIIKHFFDSLLYLKVMPEGRLRIVDIGSGAGFPGLPIKIIRPDYSLAAIEAKGKKCSFIRHIIRKLGLKDVTVVNKRIEEVTDVDAFDVAVTRALFSPQEFIEKGERLLKEQGVLIISQGPAVWQEISTIHDHACDIIPLLLPFSTITRYLVTIKKA
jgi:16S rRNA (guanine527-N7)-methyltransferase